MNWSIGKRSFLAELEGLEQPPFPLALDEVLRTSPRRQEVGDAVFKRPGPLQEKVRNGMTVYGRLTGGAYQPVTLCSQLAPSKTFVIIDTWP